MYIVSSNKKCAVIGAGFAGLSASASLAQRGFNVTLIEKNSQTGGRARVLEQDGFTFDMGPSWYWMPDVMERYFNSFGKSSRDFYELVRLDPSYQVIFGKDDVMQLSADMESLQQEFERVEKGAAKNLEKFLAEAKYKYDTAMGSFVYKPSVSILEFTHWKILSSVFRLDMFNSFSSHAKKYFRHPKLLSVIEFPVLFLGAKPSRTPSLYSMMNYADMGLGTWYPMGGMFKLAEAMTKIAEDTGVEIRLNESVEKIEIKNSRARKIISAKSEIETEVVVAASDYHHTEQKLVEGQYRNYSETYWDSKTLAPSCLIYFVGIDKKLPKLIHHNLFFDEDFNAHAAAIYDTKTFPDKPLFYVCCPSATDSSVAPIGNENLFILIPVASGLKDTEEVRKEYFKKIIRRLEAFCGENISNHVVVQKSYAASNFISDYNAYKGNAYGLANTLRQTAYMKPSIRSRKVDNLFFAGQMTVPGPGVPPAIISGQVVADYVSKKFSN